MNPSAYLKSHGWRGEGHSLDSNGKGIAKPVLLRHKRDNAGVGGHKIIGSGKDWSDGSQWWLNIYDKTLKSFDSEESSPTPPATPAEKITTSSIRLNTGSLYSNFVKAQTLEGTLIDSDSSRTASDEKMGKNSKKTSSLSDVNGKILDQPNVATMETSTIAEKEIKDRNKQAKKARKEEKKKAKTTEIGSLSVSNGASGTNQADRITPMFSEDKILLEEEAGDKKRKHEDDEIPVGDTISSKKLKHVSALTQPKTKKQLAKEAARAIRPQLKAEKFNRKIREAAANSGLVADVESIGIVKEHPDVAMPTADEPLGSQPLGAGAVVSKVVHSPVLTKVKDVKPATPHTTSLLAKPISDSKSESDSESSESDISSPDSEDREDDSEGKLPVSETPAEPHPESIAALRAKGVRVDLPGDQTDRDSVRYQIINAFETGETDRIERIWKNAVTWAKTHNPDNVTGVVAAAISKKKLSVKGEKYLREKAKRDAKRDARHWVTVRAAPTLYRPDGTLVSKHASDSSEKDKANAGKFDLKLQQEAQKEAKMSVKEQMKAERRKARAARKAERKIANHHKQQERKGMKIQLEKRERDEKRAEERGLSYDQYIAEKEKDLSEKRVVRETERAKQRGLTYEQFRAMKESGLAEKEMKKEARQLGMTLEEYANQAADEEEVDSLIKVHPGSKDGTGDTFGRSPIDAIWARHNDKQEANDKTSVEPTVGSTTVVGGGQAGADFISLNDTTPSNLFAIDTTGDASLATTKKRVKDMTKEERAARLERMRAKRAERAARREGQPKMTKKQRRKARLQRKEAVIQSMANDILAQKRKDAMATTGGGANNDGAKPGNVSKAARKQATRDARKIARGLKKGKIPQESVPESWRAAGGKKKPKPKFLKR